MSPQFLDELRARVGLVDAISRRVKLQRKGREHLGLCPFHNEKTPSFTVNEEKGFFHCFGCGAHGDVIGFVMRSEHLSFPEAIERLAAQAGLAVPQSSPQERARAEKLKTLGSALEAASTFYEKQLAGSSGRAALDYLHRRGLDETTIARFRLGWAPERNALKSHLLKEGYPETLLLEAGLIARSEERNESYDYFRARVIFPIADARGRIVAFGARTLGEATPKYINSREGELFHKGKMLYGLAHARRGAAESGRLVVVEGYMDVIALHQAGFNDAVAPLGTALTEAQLALLWRLVDEPVLCFDGDAAGERAAGRAAERALPLLAPGKSLCFVRLPAGEDPDSLLQHQGAAAVRELLKEARPLVELVWELEIAAHPADTPERRARLKERIEATARRIKNDAVQRSYRQELWERYRARFGRQGFKGSPGRPGWGGGGPAPGFTTPGDFRNQHLRHQQGLIAAILNHPALFNEVGELFGRLKLADRELDDLRQEIIKTWAPDIDSDTLKSHLPPGYGSILDRVLAAEVYAAVPFASPGQTLEAAVKGWRHGYQRLDRERLSREILEAVREHAEQMTDESLNRLHALRREIESHEAETLELDRDERLLGKTKAE
ncbi:MAG: DNA primase [Alphaproteobacteria bacterium]